MQCSFQVPAFRNEGSQNLAMRLSNFSGISAKRGFLNVICFMETIGTISNSFTLKLTAQGLNPEEVGWGIGNMFD